MSGLHAMVLLLGLLDANPRLALQVRFESAFAAFEANLGDGFREAAAK